jgi:hypothetical protein
VFYRKCLLGLVVVLSSACGMIALADDDEAGEKTGESVYELRIYTAAEGKLEALNERFREHTLKLFDKHGMENIGYWVATNRPHSETTLVYLLRHDSRAAADKSWAGFRNDPEWQKVAAESKARHGDLLQEKIDATYLVPTDYSGEITPPAKDKLYELRVYKAAEGKREALHARFREHTDRLFASHGMKSIGYWSPTEGTRTGDVLIYMLEYPDRAAARASWQAFGADSQWQAARKASEINGPLLAERPESIYMRPTDYSPTR